MGSIEYELSELFHDAEGVTDTIWYTPTETLFDAILAMLEKQGVIMPGIRDNLKEIKLTVERTDKKVQEIKTFLEGISEVDHGP